MKRSTYLLITIFLIIALLSFMTIHGISHKISECDYTKYRIVEMENNTYVIQKRIKSRWQQNICAFSSRFDSKEEACKELERLNKKLERAIKNNTVKRIIDCNTD